MAHDMKQRRYLMSKSFVMKRAAMKFTWFTFSVLMMYKLARKINPKDYETEEEMNLANNPYSLTVLAKRITGYFSIYLEGKFNKTENKSVFLPKVAEDMAELHPQAEVKK